MKTLLGYLTFAALLALCYVEKINAEAAKSRARGRPARHHAQRRGPIWVGQHLTVVQLKQ
ncbi:hypothetical protein ACN9ML_05890 [Dyadobacter endophyticus]|uniref:hypothetical protein n=1 Tax=Dyadobacter TaxID=120831 RepID=UPI003CEB21DD